MGYQQLTTEGMAELFDRTMKVRDWEFLTGLAKNFYGPTAKSVRGSVYNEGGRCYLDSVMIYDEAMQALATDPRGEVLRELLRNAESVYTAQGTLRGTRKRDWLEDCFKRIDEGEDAGELEQAVTEYLFTMMREYSITSSYSRQRTLRLTTDDHPDPNLPAIFIFTDD